MTIRCNYLPDQTCRGTTGWGGVSSAHLGSPLKITVVQADAFELDFWLIAAVVFGLTAMTLAWNVPRVAQRRPFIHTAVPQEYRMQIKSSHVQYYGRQTRDKAGGDSEELKMNWCWQKQEEGEGLLVASLPQAPCLQGIKAKSDGAGCPGGLHGTETHYICTHTLQNT